MDSSSAVSLSITLEMETSFQFLMNIFLFSERSNENRRRHFNNKSRGFLTWKKNIFLPSQSRPVSYLLTSLTLSPLVLSHKFSSRDEKSFARKYSGQNCLCVLISSRVLNKSHHAKGNENRHPRRRAVSKSVDFSLESKNFS